METPKSANAGQGKSGRRKAAGQPSTSRPSRDGAETETATETAAAAQADPDTGTGTGTTDTDTGTETAAAGGQGAQEPADGTEAAARPSGPADTGRPSGEITGDSGGNVGAGQQEGTAQEPGLAELKAENAVLQGLADELAAAVAEAAGGWGECRYCKEHRGLPAHAVRGSVSQDMHICIACLAAKRARYPDAVITLRPPVAQPPGEPEPVPEEEVGKCLRCGMAGSPAAWVPDEAAGERVQVFVCTGCESRAPKGQVSRKQPEWAP